jgi:hypothetical protein
MFKDYRRHPLKRLTPVGLCLSGKHDRPEMIGALLTGHPSRIKKEGWIHG